MRWARRQERREVHLGTLVASGGLMPGMSAVYMYQLPKSCTKYEECVEISWKMEDAHGYLGFGVH